MADPRNPSKLPILVSLLLQFALSTALFAPTDNHLLDCGSSSPSALPDRRVFLPDSTLLLHSPSSPISLSNPSPSPSPLYSTARIFPHPASYSFPINQRGTHLLRLHFHPFSTPTHNLSSAHFHVSASGFVLLTDFTPSAPSIKEYLIRVDDDKLVVSFTPVCSSSFAFVNAIEVVSAPADLIADVARLVTPDQIENLDGLSNQALETLYRINVGGAKVTPLNDTLWRTWVPDSEFLSSSSPSRTVSFSGRIMYRKDGASREVAPDSVYNTARLVDDSKSNMTWAFEVDSGYRYLVRMHFCDIASLALNELYFNVYVNGYLGYQDFDISDATGKVLASPYYADFVVDVENSGSLSVSIGPSKFSRPSKVDGLLNGLEIMKINNTVGSLSGKIPVSLVLGTRRMGILGAFIQSLVCGLAFVCLVFIAFKLILRLRAESRDPVAWSRLPVDVSEGRPAKGSSAVPGKSGYF